MRPDTDDYMTTFTGVHFKFVDPNPDEITIEDIAHSLSMQCRYNGHCSDFYSVGEHSVLVAEWVLAKSKNKRMALEALLHDSPETYLTDVVRPIKPHLDPQYAQLEHGLERAVARRFNLTLPWNQFIKEADSRICLDEYAALFADTQGPVCPWTLDFDEPLGVKILCLDPHIAKRAFLKMYHKLVGE